MKYNILIAIILILFLNITGCNIQVNTASQKDIETMSIESTDKEIESPKDEKEIDKTGEELPNIMKNIKESSLRFRVIDKKVLTDNLDAQNLYQRYYESKDDKILERLEPIDVFLLYLCANEKADLETGSYLINLEGDYSDLPTLEELLEETKYDQISKDNAIKMYNKILNDTKNIYEVIKEENIAFIFITFKTENEEEPIYYRFEKTKSGIWKLGWLACQ